MRNLTLLQAKIRDRWLEALLLLGFVGLLAWLGTLAEPYVRPYVQAYVRKITQARPQPFSGEVAFQHVAAQLALGPRPTGSEANRRTAEYITVHLSQHGWQVEHQDFVYRGVSGRNIIGRAGQGPVVILGAHYDTRRQADRDPSPALRGQPVPGANDGASGVAVLLELARVLRSPSLPYEIWLVFFDAEDNGGLDGWDFIVGSTYMANTLRVKPEMVIVVDMIGDAEQQIYQERTSTRALVAGIWQVAAELGYGEFFLPAEKYSITDDHTPFLRLGIPAVDLIDFDYPYWHTTQDTLDKVSPASLERVGRVLQRFLELRPFPTPQAHK
ncbi:MAG: M28 family peptidase [Anaerolineae bacterium]